MYPEKWPRWLILTAVIVTALGIVPFALIAKARVTTTTRPRIMIVPDMNNQPKFRAQQADPMFADGRAMRPPVPGTIARGDLRLDDAYFRGERGGEWITAFPVPLDARLVQRGQERFGIYCTPCHGWAGYGDGIVARRADRLQEGTWTPPASLHTDLVRSRPVGQLFNTISNGVRAMPAYGPQIPVADRWAIVAFVRALQRSQDARLGDVPPELRSQLRQEQRP
jgi:mono/diheme cytochrome c family protein